MIEIKIIGTDLYAIKTYLYLEKLSSKTFKRKTKYKTSFSPNF